MLQIRMMTFKDTEEVRPIFQEAPNYFNKQKLIIDHTFVIDESNTILGLASYKMKDETTVLVDLLYVSKERRGEKLGDGLLRALLNHLNFRGVKTVFINSQEASHGFFVSEGLEIAATDPNDTSNLVFRATLPDFFQGGCKSGGREA